MKQEFGRMVMEDTDIMPFGKYTGKKMIDVPADWLLWFYNENLKGKPTGDRLLVWNYCFENLQVLQSQVKK